ncbi:MAG: hypothetical protein HFF69_00615 [Oscillospiraceae bacterium]|jgi:hypothetical protein|nr:hypothetical protein [Oscillospiraceae bacterium]
MKQKIQPYLSIGIDIGADFSVMAAALPNQEIISRTYKILHSSLRSVEGAVERIRSLEQTYGLPVKIYRGEQDKQEHTEYKKRNEGSFDILPVSEYNRTQWKRIGVD